MTTHLNRSQWLHLLHSATKTGSYRFARLAALDWLAHYPGDLEVSRLYASYLITEEQIDTARQQLERLVTIDPLDALSWRMLAQLDPTARPAAFVLDPTVELASPSAGISALSAAWKQLNQGQTAEAEQAIHLALTSLEPNPLIASLHLHIIFAQSANTGQSAFASLSEFYYQRFAQSLPVAISMAHTWMQQSKPGHGVALLHRIATQDTQAITARRLWQVRPGVTFPYARLWPQIESIPFTQQIPAAVSAWLGWNRLAPAPSASPSAAPPSETTPLPESMLAGLEETSAESAAVLPETKMPPSERAIAHSTNDPQPAHAQSKLHSAKKAVRQAAHELERIAHSLNQPEIAASAGNFPVYVLLSARKPLIQRYGESGMQRVEQAMQQLATAVNQRGGWRAVVLFCDDPASCAALQIKPIPAAKDAWAVKRSLVDLDSALRKRGEMLGALLIAGGPEIIPFHRLPNPLDDVDQDVPSDNPYATRDENYFIAEWPVGRIPGENSGDPSSMVYALKLAANRHALLRKHSGLLSRLKTLWKVIWTRLRGLDRNLGYSAAIWRRSSEAAFDPIRNVNALFISPPSTDQTWRKSPMPASRLAYYNLHGVPDAPEWFGHNDPGSPLPGPDYPIALHPDNVQNSGRAPQIVFSEACYGAHIENKRLDEALALKFLASGTQIMVGSTVTSYGAVAPPLIAADLLAWHFWKLLDSGVMAGEALRRAKLALISEMESRQGYLDGEDQKTLLSFVLYGDPLTQTRPGTIQPKSVLRPVHAPQMHTVCERHVDSEPVVNIPEDTLVVVRRMVRQYLPGMIDADLELASVHAGCDGHDHTCPTSHFGVKTRPQAAPRHRVVTLRKQVQAKSITHRQFARLTLDEQNTVVKFAVSR